jgi:hypothetical protein
VGASFLSFLRLSYHSTNFKSCQSITILHRNFRLRSGILHYDLSCKSRLSIELINNLNLKEMDSDDEDFPKQGGEALEIGDDFDSEEEADEMPPNPKDAMRQPMKG